MLRSRKYPGGARFNCTDSFNTPNNEGKFSCKAVTGSLFLKNRGKHPTVNKSKHVLQAHFRSGQLESRGKMVYLTDLFVLF